MKRKTDQHISLEDYRLEYEEVNPKAAAKSTNVTKKTKNSKTGSIFSKFKSLKSPVKGNNKKATKPRKKAKKLTKAQRESARIERNRVILGLGQLLVVISIAYSTAVIVLGTEGYIPLVMIAPQAVLAVVITSKHFTK